ncbi:MarR family winged helix-turn-helix transcriptional regulator [Amycolatopsis jiangsuensis]|uniref:DNA-binding MarR family transcriptional regulator n=1 Tax=Amycolatopsis jiangsuensis TaxID=1181879 RepID=A0A840ILI8_9PSEU|nr:MarR family transcriptional regulator [Amycolatopsis jiangsuensis]MBB4682850.1 DNA-binding MarR family transcriptional regulator [Amycolatopsis jiangsuensis]
MEPDRALLMELLPRLNQLSRSFNRGRLFERAIEASGIGLDHPSVQILTTLQLAGEPLRIGEIASRLQVVGPHVTRQVQVLEKRGLVERVTDPADQRARLIAPTAPGRAAAEKYFGAVLGWFTDALADWSPEDRSALGRLLGRFADDLSARLSRLDTEAP